MPDHHASITEPHARGLAGHLFLLHLRISGASAGATNNLFDSKFEQVLFLRDQESFISVSFYTAAGVPLFHHSLHHLPDSFDLSQFSLDVDRVVGVLDY